jgi:hypothetical protein
MHFSKTTEEYTANTTQKLAVYAKAKRIGNIYIYGEHDRTGAV